MNTITTSKIKRMSLQLVVADLDNAIDFQYEDFYTGIIKDDCSIHLKIGKPSREMRQDKRSNEHLDILFSIEDIENLYEEILARSVEIVQPLRSMPYGKEFYIADPDGYIICFIE